MSCAAPNFHLSLYKSHKKRSTLFFHLKVTKFILLLLSKNKLIHTLTQMKIETSLYQHLRNIITLIQCTSKRNMISYVDDCTKGSMANTICIYYFIKSIISDNDCTELGALLMLMFVRTVDLFACVY